AARRDQGVAVRVAPGPDILGGEPEPVPSLTSAFALDHLGVGREDERVFDAVGPGDVGSPAVPPAAEPPGGVDGLVERGAVEDAEEHAAVLVESAADAGEWDAVEERPGRVDGVDVPAALRAGADLAELLAEDPVLGEAGFDEFADGAFGFAVRDRHGRGVRLGLDADAGLVVRERDSPGAPGDLDGEVEERTEGCRVHGPVLWGERLGSPPAARARLTSWTERVPSWNAPAARTAAAPARNASQKCATAAPPPLAVTGTATAPATARTSSRS